MLRSGIRVALPVLAPDFIGEAAALPCAHGLGKGVTICCNLQLDPAKQQQNHHNDEQQSQPAAGEIAPGTTVIPCRESAHQKQDQQHNQNGSKHTFILQSLKIQLRTTMISLSALVRSE